MGDYIIPLSLLQLLNLVVYSWVQRNFAGKPRLLQPKIFENKLAGIILIAGPVLLGLALMVLAFFIMDSPWLFVGLSIAGFIAFATPR